MLWITLTSRRDGREVRIDANRILELEQHHKHTKVLLERNDGNNHRVEVKEDPKEISEKIKTSWHYNYGPGSQQPRVFDPRQLTPTTEFWDPRTGAENIGSFVRGRHSDWDVEHEQVRRELIAESPDLFPDGEVPEHLEVALNSNVAVYIRNRRALRKSELEDLLGRIKIDSNNAKAKGP